jgi:hypothetical protein
MATFLHDPNSYFVKLAENGRSIQNGGSKSNFLALIWKLSKFFQLVFCIIGVSKTQVLRRISFPKNPRWRLFLFKPPFWICWKTFLPQNFVLLTSIQCKKTNWKNVDNSQISAKNQILICHFRLSYHFWLIWQYMSLGHAIM